jgi:hypothetical protein
MCSSKFRNISVVVLAAILSRAAVARQAPADFAGEWAAKLQGQVFMVVRLAPLGSGENFGGGLSRPQHFTTSGAAFSEIKGPVVEEPIVRSAINGKCISFTTQNPKDKSDETEFQLCVTDLGHGTLKINMPGFEAWPVTKEKGLVKVAVEWDSGRSYVPDEGYASSAEMEKIFAADQKDRQASPRKTDWTVVEKADAVRRAATLSLLNEGRLHTGEDFSRAAFVFQHGDTSDDYLLAHTLAMVAMAKGQSSAMWIAAATLDRYLNSIHQPQIYGTQFYTRQNEATTQEPYNRGLISDALRRQLGVPSQAAQGEQKKAYDRERAVP